ncbi:ParA family protein [Bacillus sp. S17B2]|uniref:ParA family protein n=1 Tax=Bacillus sp. S17B2 TaxID=2918907 RepID=UPI00227EED4C|nr:ParA family protein [Bacillus sp. S17B2]
MAKVIGVSTNKGGVLKTTITTSFAGLLAKSNKKVLIIDTDNQGNSSITFGQNPDSFEITLYDVLLGENEPQEAIINVYKGIDILPSNDDMGFFELDVITQKELYPAPTALLKTIVEKVKGSYDYILIDCPPNLGLVLGNVLNVADEIIIPFQPEVYSMRSLTKILKQIENFKEGHNPGLQIAGVVGTLVDSRTNVHTEVLQECRRYCYEKGIHMFDTVIPKSIRSANSVAYEKLPAVLVEKSSNRLIDSYYSLFEEAFGVGTKK